jgi:hypothetical protein
MAEFISRNSTELPILLKMLRENKLSEEDAKNILKPQNEDNKIVWLWLNKLDNYKKKNLPLTWEQMVKYSADSGYFLIIIKGKPLTCFWALSSNSPSELLCSLCKYKITLSEAEDFLKGEKTEKNTYIEELLSVGADNEQRRSKDAKSTEENNK